MGDLLFHCYLLAIVNFYVQRNCSTRKFQSCLPIGVLLFERGFPLTTSITLQVATYFAVSLKIRIVGEKTTTQVKGTDARNVAPVVAWCEQHGGLCETERDSCFRGCYGKKEGFEIFNEIRGKRISIFAFGAEYIFSPEGRSLK